MGIDICLECDNQELIENELKMNNLDKNWRWCCQHSHYTILQATTGWLPMMNSTGAINDIETIKHMSECVSYFIQTSEFVDDEILPQYDSEIYECFAVDLTDRHKTIDTIDKEKSEEYKVIANKLLLWLQIGIKYNAHIFVC